MAKLKLIMQKGLPASGKSTNAKMLAESGYYRVNKDDIREMLFGEHYKRKHEKQVIWTRDAMIRTALGHGKSVELVHRLARIARAPGRLAARGNHLHIGAAQSREAHAALQHACDLRG